MIIKKTAMSSIKDIKLQPFLFHCLNFFLKTQGSSPHQTGIEQRITLITSKLDEERMKGGIKLAASDDKITLLSILS